MNQYVKSDISEMTATITVDYPPANSLAPEVRDELQNGLKSAMDNPKVWTIVITAAGEKFFMAGANIPSLLKLERKEALQRAKAAREFFSLIESGGKPVIAAINGVCFGGGLELALCCDIRVAADHALLGLPEVGLGIMPGGGGTQRLPRLIGSGMARYLIFTGDRITAKEARRVGLVENVVPYEGLLSEAKRVAGMINSRGPLGVRAAKRSMNEVHTQSLEKGLDIENELWADLFETNDKNEGIQAFLEKRKPIFQGN